MYKENEHPPTTSSNRSGSPRRRRARAVAAALTAAIVIGTAGYGVGHLDAATVPSAPAASAVATWAGIPPTTSIRPLLDKVLPSVVSIGAEGPRGSGQGSGIIVSAGGEVLTNAHVVAGATKVSVTRYGSNDQLAGRVIGSSVANDLALIQIEGAANLPTAHLGSSAGVRVGDPVVAVGNALGLAPGTPSVTTGIVSAEDRSISTGSGGSINGLIQTDAAINPGNSGGPLFDGAGTVIGINTAVAGRSGAGLQAQNIGFAIPVDRVQSLLGELRSGGPKGTAGATLGVATVTISDSLRDAYGLTPRPGAVVTAVDAGSPASQAGVSRGDVIVGVDNQPVISTEELRAVVAGRHPGDRLTLHVIRNRDSLALTAVLAAPGSAPPAS